MQNKYILYLRIVWTDESNDAPAHGGNSCPFHLAAFTTTNPAEGQKYSLIPQQTQLSTLDPVTINQSYFRRETPPHPINNLPLEQHFGRCQKVDGFIFQKKMLAWWNIGF